GHTRWPRDWSSDVCSSDLAKAIEVFYQPPQYAPGVHPTAMVHASAKIGVNAHIGPYVAIDRDVQIGDNAILLAHVVIYTGVKIGDRKSTRLNSSHVAISYA